MTAMKSCVQSEHQTDIIFTAQNALSGRLNKYKIIFFYLLCFGSSYQKEKSNKYGTTHLYTFGNG